MRRLGEGDCDSQADIVVARLDLLDRGGRRRAGRGAVWRSSERRDRGGKRRSPAGATRCRSFDLDEQAVINRRGAYTRSCFMPGDDANWVIEHVAVKPGHRGRGLMQALLAHACAEGAAAGHRRASIMFYIGNDAAERCYTKIGFSFAEERRDPAFEALTGAPGFRRFERAI